MRNVTHDLSKHYQKLVEIHAAPRWLWLALVQAMLPTDENRKGWTVEQTKAAVARLTKMPEKLPDWCDKVFGRRVRLAEIRAASGIQAKQW